MNININNQSNTNIVLLSDVENILTFNEPYSGEFAQIILPFTNDLSSTVSSDGQYYITLFDETITNVVQYQNATNRRFWISSTLANTAASVANALRSCSSIAADWHIRQSSNIVYLTAKRVGNKLSNYTYWNRTNIGASYLSITAISAGSSTSSLLDGKAVVDVTSGTSVIGRMSKQIYGQYTDFNISPMLSDETPYGSVATFTLSPSTVNVNGSVAEYTTMDVYMVKGYECNGSSPYLVPTNARILWNKQHNGADNINYLYDNSVDFSVMTDTTQAQTIYFRLYDSAMSKIFEGSNVQTVEGRPSIADRTYVFPTSAFTDAYHAEIQIGDDTLRFQVIKPLRATEYFQRVFWRNEYGGIQFFDFTAQKSEQFNVGELTYNKNTFDRYRTDIHTASEKIYANETEKTYTLSTHLMQRGGKYALDSLALAKEVWTEIGDETYHIIPTQVSVTENDEYNNIFTAQISYRIV